MVVPAKAGTHEENWAPAFAGETTKAPEWGLFFSGAGCRRLEASGDAQAVAHHLARDLLAARLSGCFRALDRHAHPRPTDQVVSQIPALVHGQLDAFQLALATRDDHLAALATLLHRAQEAVVGRAAGLTAVGAAATNDSGAVTPATHH